jgi:hypothetical protein
MALLTLPKRLSVSCLRAGSECESEGPAGAGRWPAGVPINVGRHPPCRDAKYRENAAQGLVCAPRSESEGTPWQSSFPTPPDARAMQTPTCLPILSRLAAAVMLMAERCPRDRRRPNDGRGARASIGPAAAYPAASRAHGGLYASQNSLWRASRWRQANPRHTAGDCRLGGIFDPSPSHRMAYRLPKKNEGVGPSARAVHPRSAPFGRQQSARSGTLIR